MDQMDNQNFLPEAGPASVPPDQPSSSSYQTPQAQSGGRGSRRAWIIQIIVLALIVVVILAGIGVIVDRVFFSKAQSGNFKLAQSPSYKEALVDIRGNFYRDYSEAKIKTAAQAAVQKEKKKGVKSDIDLENASLTALLKALDEAHTEYMDPNETKLLSESLSGSFFGVGLMLRGDAKTKRPKVVSIIKGSPSDKAGIRKNDIVMSVDGKDTKGERLDVVVGRIRGKKGTKVIIKVERAGLTKELSFTMTREKIDIPDLESEILDGKYGYLHVFNFSKGIASKVRIKVQEMQGKGVKGFILDLRDDPGGLLDEAVKMGSVFIPNGVIVSYQRKGQDKVDYNATGGVETNLPLVVLTNGGSASSSEIVTGALKDHKRATLVGAKTYGKGSIQKVFDIENGGSAKITVAMYYLPNGESIDGKGIVPDITVEIKNNPDQEETQQLDKAKQVLQNLIDGKPATGLVLLPAA